MSRDKQEKHRIKRNGVEIILVGEKGEDGKIRALQNMIVDLTEFGPNYGVVAESGNLLYILTDLARFTSDLDKDDIFHDLDEVLPWEIFLEFLEKPGKWEEEVRGFLYAGMGGHGTGEYGGYLKRLIHTDVIEFVEEKCPYLLQYLDIDTDISFRELWEIAHKETLRWAGGLLKTISSFTDFLNTVRGIQKTYNNIFHDLLKQHSDLVKIKITIKENESGLGNVLNNLWMGPHLFTTLSDLEDVLDQINETLQRYEVTKMLREENVNSVAHIISSDFTVADPALDTVLIKNENIGLVLSSNSIRKILAVLKDYSSPLTEYKPFVGTNADVAVHFFFRNVKNIKLRSPVNFQNPILLIIDGVALNFVDKETLKTFTSILVNALSEMSVYR